MTTQLVPSEAGTLPQSRAAMGMREVGYFGRLTAVNEDGEAFLADPLMFQSEVWAQKGPDGRPQMVQVYFFFPICGAATELRVRGNSSLLSLNDVPDAARKMIRECLIQAWEGREHIKRQSSPIVSL